jgi:hypothetical protein
MQTFSNLWVTINLLQSLEIVLFGNFSNKLLENMVFGLGLLDFKLLFLQFAKQQQNYKNNLLSYLSYRKIWRNFFFGGWLLMFLHHKSEKIIFS